MNSDAARAANEAAWDRRARRGDRFTEPAEDELFADPLTALGGAAWLGGPLAGRRVLCLAAGGGRQGPLAAAAGAIVTVVDVSGEQLAVDRRVAAERNLALSTVQAGMDDLSALHSGGFEVVLHPVSTCYVPAVAPVYREVARVLVAGGLYSSQHKQPTSLQAGAAPRGGKYVLDEPYYRGGPLPAVEGSKHREPGAVEFLHRWEELLGEMCRVGFVIEDLIEPCHADPTAAAGTFGHRSAYTAPYVKIKARRRGDATTGRTSKLWTPHSS